MRAERSSVFTQISDRIARLDPSFVVRDTRAVSGGSINNAYVLVGERNQYFIKLNTLDHLVAFEAEAGGLAEIAASKTVRVPKVIACGALENEAFLVLEYLMLARRQRADRTFGEQLADMHRMTRSQFGWHRDNTIGATPQRNAWERDWITFWREHRLRFQLALATANGYGGKLRSEGEKLCSVLPAFFEGYSPGASLLHGDLWSGNYATLASGEPVIYDPAVYYGDRETDIAMSELFGGFGKDFYAAYRDRYPLDRNYPLRRDLYNLYHVLNHLNLFRGGYLRQAENMVSKLLAEVQ